MIFSTKLNSVSKFSSWKNFAPAFSMILNRFYQIHTVIAGQGIRFHRFRRFPWLSRFAIGILQISFVFSSIEGMFFLASENHKVLKALVSFQLEKTPTYRRSVASLYCFSNQYKQSPSIRLGCSGQKKPISFYTSLFYLEKIHLLL